MNKNRFIISVLSLLISITLLFIYLFDRKSLFEMFDYYYKLEDSNNE